MKEVPVPRKAKQAEAHQLRQKALEPQQRYCYITKRDVNILVEYPDYKGPHFKGPEGEIYCEHILECYQNNVRCRWSGISPLFPDPFVPQAGAEAEEASESEEKLEPGQDAEIEEKEESQDNS